jgi:predicted dehydrogenase
MKVAVVGLGKMGLLHASILNVLPNVQLTALCDKNQMIARFFRKIFVRTQIVDDLERLSRFDLDAIHVTTPIPTHFPVAKTAYSQGIARNIFVEKTLASSFEQAEELCKMSQDSRGVGMVGYMKRFAVTFGKARDLLNHEIIGKTISFSAYAYSSDFARTEGRSRTSSSRGGVLRDLGAHVIDLALWFLGDMEVESAKLKSVLNEKSEDIASFKVTSSSGATGSFSISWCARDYRLPEFGLTISGSKGTIKVSDDKVELELNEGVSEKWYRHDLKDNVGFLLGEPEYFREDKHFIESILQNRIPESSFTIASKVDYLIDQVKCRAEKNET